MVFRMSLKVYKQIETAQRNRRFFGLFYVGPGSSTPWQRPRYYKYYLIFFQSRQNITEHVFLDHDAGGGFEVFLAPLFYFQDFFL